MGSPSKAARWREESWVPTVCCVKQGHVGKCWPGSAGWEPGGKKEKRRWPTWTMKSRHFLVSTFGAFSGLIWGALTILFCIQLFWAVKFLLPLPSNFPGIYPVPRSSNAAIHDWLMGFLSHCLCLFLRVWVWDWETYVDWWRGWEMKPNCLESDSAYILHSLMSGPTYSVCWPQSSPLLSEDTSNTSLHRIVLKFTWNNVYEVLSIMPGKK